MQDTIDDSVVVDAPSEDDAPLGAIEYAMKNKAKTAGAIAVMFLVSFLFSGGNKHDAESVKPEVTQALTQVQALNQEDKDEYEDPFTSETAESLKAQYEAATERLDGTGTQLSALAAKVGLLSEKVKALEVENKILLETKQKATARLNYRLLGTFKDVVTNEWVAEIKVGREYKKVKAGDVIKGHQVKNVGPEHVFIL